MAQLVEKTETKQPLEKKEKNKTKAYDGYIRPIRLVPVWLKIILVILLMAICVIIGAVIGYGVIGEGRPLDVLKIETWKHLYDLINPL